jgi:GNAT superfamily N-acetyltransferase
VTQLGIEKLGRQHAVDDFDCGHADLNRYLTRHALQNQSAYAGQTYIALDGDEVIGFYTLVVGEVALDEVADRLRKGLARHTIPVMLLVRMAVAGARQKGSGIGPGLLKDAIVRTLNAADFAGIRALVVHAKNDEARGFYAHYGFVESPSDPMHLHVLLKDLKRMYAAAQR